MSSVKIRLVKCPNCWNVLPESVDVPVYKCGGCGKILQAKYRQQLEEDAEKLDMQGGKDVGDEASGSSKSEELDKNDDELHEANNEVSEIAAEQNSHVSFVEDEEEEEINGGGGILTNNESGELLQQNEEEAPPSYFKRIMSGSTEYHDPCSTFSETCNSPPPTTTQTIRYYNYDASVSSLDDNTRGYFLSSSSYSQKPLLLPHDNSRWRRIRDTKGVYESAANGTSPYLDKRLPPRPRYPSDENNFRSYNKPASPPEYIDEEKMKLLKIVYELEEQLLKKKTSSLQPTSRSHELRHWNHDDMMISSSYRNRQLHSEPLPPPPYKKNIHRNSRTGQSSIINSYSSWPSSPPVDDLLSPWQDQLDGFQKMKKKKKKKKQHLRPIAGAAPFIACQNCPEFLQLPEDFLLFKGRCHRVRCGGCSTVMSFSLENRTFLVPYYQEDDEEDDLDFRAPPPSEADHESSSSMMMMMKMRSSSSTSRGKKKMTYSHSTGGPPLHNLMGYSTVSRVFKGYGPSSSSSSSIQNR